MIFSSLHWRARRMKFAGELGDVFIRESAAKFKGVPFCGIE